jgi:hypothetical protein
MGVVKLVSKTFDLCEEAYVFLKLAVSTNPTQFHFRRNAQADVQCPVSEGNYVVEQTFALPKQIPQGELPSISFMLLSSSDMYPSAKFNINARAYNFDDNDLFCVDLMVNFMRKPFPKLSLGW